MDNGYSPLIHPNQNDVEICMTYPVYQKKFKEKHACEIEDAPRDESEAATGRNLGEAAQE